MAVASSLQAWLVDQVLGELLEVAMQMGKEAALFAVAVLVFGAFSGRFPASLSPGSGQGGGPSKAAGEEADLCGGPSRRAAAGRCWPCPLALASGAARGGGRLLAEAAAGAGAAAAWGQPAGRLGRCRLRRPGAQAGPPREVPAGAANLADYVSASWLGVAPPRLLGAEVDEQKVSAGARRRWQAPGPAHEVAFLAKRLHRSCGRCLRACARGMKTAAAQACSRLRGAARLSAKQRLALAVQALALVATLALLHAIAAGAALKAWLEPCANPLTCHAMAGGAVFGAGALLNCKAFFQIPVI